MRIDRIFILVFLVPFHFVSAQHDGARNSTQQIALGKFGKVEQILKDKKPFAGEAESHFVRMLGCLAQNDLEGGLEEARKAVAAGLPFERLLVGPREQLEKLHALESFKIWRKEFSVPNIVHGPMVGHVTHQAASIWIRTLEPDSIPVRLLDSNRKLVKEAVITTVAQNDFTGTVRFEGLKSNQTYTCDLGDGTTATFNTSAESKGSQFKVAFGGGAGYVPEWEYMWDTIRSHNPHAMLMLGDNVYIDQPEHTLTQYYCYYRRQSRPEWKRLVRSTAIYSIWDDHDFGTNDCNPGPRIESPPWKRKVWNIFRQNWINPAYGGGIEQPGCWYDFHIADVHFIMLDGRYYRDRKGGSMLGPVQHAWLLKTLSESRGTFKVLVSPVPFTPGIKPGSKDPWDGFPEERESIFSLIESKKIPGVFLVAADRHRTDLRKIARPSGYTLYEFESSRLTNHHTHKVIETDGLVWGYNKTCSFGLMEFDTQADDPQVTMKCISIDNNEIHQFILKRSDLEHP